MYDSIVPVEAVKRPSRHGNRDAYLIVRSVESYRRPYISDMVFTKEPQPNYCEYNKEEGISGTVGRLCNKTSKEMNGCELLCCGRGYDTHEIQERFKCHCKFRWCCDVTCRKCKKQTMEHRCK